MGKFEKLVSLTVSGVPRGVTSKFTVPSSVPPFTSTLNLNIPLSTPEGSYTLTIQGEGGEKTHSIKVTVNVKKKHFTLTVHPEVAGIKVKVEGTLTPPTPGTKLILQYHSHTHQEGEEGKTIAREVNVKPDGSFTDEFTLEILGEWEVKAILNDEYGNAVAVSETEYFTVEKSFMNQLLILTRGNMLLLILPILAAIIAGLGVVIVRKGKRVEPASASSALYCRNCGAPLNIEDEFCSACGARKDKE